MAGLKVLSVGSAESGDGVALLSSAHPYPVGSPVPDDADVSPDSVETVEIIAPPPPDRCSIDPASPYFRPDYARIGVLFDGIPISNCAEYCVSENWIKGLVSDRRGNWIKERGKPRTVLKPGKVEPYWKG